MCVFRQPESSQEFILCAAIKRVEPRKTSLTGGPYYEGTNDILDIELGYRHHDIFYRFKEEVSRKPSDQGFYTSKGRFVSRREAMKIAYKAGQLDEERSSMCFNEDTQEWERLFSEDLY